MIFVCRKNLLKVAFLINCCECGKWEVLWCFLLVWDSVLMRKAIFSVTKSFFLVISVIRFGVEYMGICNVETMRVILISFGEWCGFGVFWGWCWYVNSMASLRIEKRFCKELNLCHILFFNALGALGISKFYNGSRA